MRGVEKVFRRRYYMEHPNAVRRVSDCRVADGVDTLSDHLYTESRAMQTGRVHAAPCTVIEFLGKAEEFGQGRLIQLRWQCL